MPSCHRNNDEDGHGYELVTLSEKLVSDYTGLNFFEIGEIDIYDYFVYQRDAFIHKMERTKAGQDYLYDCWLFEQVEPDRVSLRKFFGGDR